VCPLGPAPGCRWRSANWRSVHHVSGGMRQQSGGSGAVRIRQGSGSRSSAASATGMRRRGGRSRSRPVPTGSGAGCAPSSPPPTRRRCPTTRRGTSPPTCPRATLAWSRSCACMGSGCGWSSATNRRICARLGAISGPQRRGDPPPLATRLLRLRLLLVATAPARRRGGTGEWSRRGATGRRRGGGAGGKYPRPACHAAGPWHYAPCAPGSYRGSSCGAAGALGRRCPRRRPCTRHLRSFDWGAGSISTPRPDPRPQSTVSSFRIARS
jgi:hypothetical protein